jgi:hypothetical protein
MGAPCCREGLTPLEVSTQHGHQWDKAANPNVRTLFPAAQVAPDSGGSSDSGGSGTGAGAGGNTVSPPRKRRTSITHFTKTAASFIGGRVGSSSAKAQEPSRTASGRMRTKAGTASWWCILYKSKLVLSDVILDDDPVGSLVESFIRNYGPKNRQRR